MYNPTIRSIKREYSLLNKKVFGGVLPISSKIEFQIGNMLGTLGICKYIISRSSLVIKLLPVFRDRKLFVAILAHEMVHVFEFTRYQKMTHGPKFYKWKSLFAEHGIVLAKKY